MDSRLADSPRTAMTAKVMEREMGITKAVRMAALRFPRNKMRAIVTSNIPKVALSRTLLITESNELPFFVIRNNLNSFRKNSVIKRHYFFMNRLDRGNALFASAEDYRPHHNIVVFIVSYDASPGNVAQLT